MMSLETHRGSRSIEGTVFTPQLKEQPRDTQTLQIRQWMPWEVLGAKEECKSARRTRAGRALRDTRYRSVVEQSRQTKRLFTPEIKKFLKGWLIRRRKNPYPNRSEKKDLALKTGLTYMQICNWFANWRRKLKKSSREGTGLSGGGEIWGPLITGYNRQARGNVEQFSISSDDSIWDEANYNHPATQMQTSNLPRNFITNVTQQPPQHPQSFIVQTTPAAAATTVSTISRTSQLDAGRSKENPSGMTARTGTPALLKWLESAARFRPRQPCWSPPVSWSTPTHKRARVKHRPSLRDRHREELDAAEALTFLSASSSLHRLSKAQCV